MIKLAIVTALALSTAMGAGQAFADCVAPPQVSGYMANLHSWHIVENSDLVTDDQALWQQSHGGDCPGLAEADLDGRGQMSYGLVLRNGMRLREVILLNIDGNMRVKTLGAWITTGGVPVVVSVGNGEAHQWDNGKTIVIAHDSLEFIHLEASARRYYWEGKQLKSIQTSD